MSPMERSAAESAISSALMAQWDPLGVRHTPGVHEEYVPFAHEIYNMLIRGASDTQVGRYLHKLESDEFGHPELAAADLSPVLTTLRALERKI